MTAQPGGRLPAPPHLAPLQDLLNTVNLESGEDELAAEAFAGLGGGPRGDRRERGRPDCGCRRSARTCATGSTSHDERGPGRRGRRRSPRRGCVVAVVDGGLRTTSRDRRSDAWSPSTVEGIRVAQRDDDWKRLKVCARGTCRWAFYDHSRNNSSRWCASSICGAREKSRRAYRRRVGRTSRAATRCDGRHRCRWTVDRVGREVG